MDVSSCANFSRFHDLLLAIMRMVRKYQTSVSKHGMRRMIGSPKGASVHIHCTYASNELQNDNNGTEPALEICWIVSFAKTA